MQASTRKKWRSIVDRQKQSDLTIEQFCHQLNISPSTFYQRKRELTILSQPSGAFVKASITQKLEVETQSSPIHFTLGKANLMLPEQTSPQYLAAFINELSL